MGVLLITYRLKEKSVMPAHPDPVAIFPTDQDVKLTYPDAKSEELRFCYFDFLFTVR